MLSPLVAIDLTAAFDTVDHSLLLDVLTNCFGVTGEAKAWMSSYLTSRCFDVSINGIRSNIPCRYTVFGSTREYKWTSVFHLLHEHSAP